MLSDMPGLLQRNLGDPCALRYTNQNFIQEKKCIQNMHCEK